MTPRMLKSILAWSTGCLIIASSVTANAALIGVDRIDPDITAAGFSTVTYDAGSDTLTVANPVSLLSYNSPSAVPTTFSGDWTLTANIDENGVLGSSLLTVFNATGLPGIADNTTVIEGALTDIGFLFLDAGSSNVIMTFDFLLDAFITTPSLGFGPVIAGIFSGAFVDVADINDPFAASFSLLFGDPQTDTFAVPSPAPLTLILLASGGILLSKRRAQRMAA